MRIEVGILENIIGDGGMGVRMGKHKTGGGSSKRVGSGRNRWKLSTPK